MLDEKLKNICEKRLLLLKRVIRLMYTFVFCYFIYNVSFCLLEKIIKYEKRKTKHISNPKRYHTYSWLQ